MILIADSGSTKTDWRLIDGPLEVGQIKTKGFNPYYQKLDEMVQEVETQLVPYLDPLSINKIHF